MGKIIQGHPQNYIVNSYLSYLYGLMKTNDNVGFKIRGLEGIKAIKFPVEMTNVSEIKISTLQGILCKFGELIGDIENIRHKMVADEDEKDEYASKFNGILGIIGI